MDINVNIQGEIHLPEIALLCQALNAHPAPAVAAAPAPAPSQTPVVPVPVPAPVAPAPASAPIAAPAPAVAPVPAPAPVAVPTGAPTYSIDDIARAGAALAQQGPDKVAALTGLLQQFGLQAVTQLKPDQMGAFVTALRGMGAQI